MTPFFIVGMQRSGTTMLSVMLSKHTDIYMEPNAMGFRMVTALDNAQTLWPKNAQHPKDEFFEWLIQTDKNPKLAELISFKDHKSESLQSIFSRSIEKRLKENGAMCWGDKAPNLQHYVPEILRVLPQAKFIHMLRDGRANAFSMSKRNPMSLRLAAQQWVEGNAHAVVNHKILGPDQYLIVKYEDLLVNQKSSLERISNFLDISFQTSMLDLSSNVEADVSYVRPEIDVSKIDKWKSDMTSGQIDKVETIQADVLNSFNYDVMNTKYLNNAKGLSVFSQILLHQKDGFKALFRGKKMVMQNKELIELKIPFRQRARKFVSQIARDILEKRIYQSIFSRIFYHQDKM